MFENFHRIAEATSNSARLLRVPIGINENGIIEEAEIGSGTCHHIMVCGHAGSGKSVYLHSLIHSLLLNYSAENVHLWLSDSGMCEFDCFAKTAEAHIEYVNIEDKPDNYVAFINALVEEIRRRCSVLALEQASSYDSYWEKKNTKPFPRLIVVIDSFDQFARELVNTDHKYGKELEGLVRCAYAYGITFVISVQGVDSLFHHISYHFLEKFDVRIITRQSSDLIIRYLGEKAAETARNMRLGEALVNVPFVHKVTLPYLSLKTRTEILKNISEA